MPPPSIFYMNYFKVKNWDQFQHYKDRNPPWIKLHFETLSSHDWVMLADASKLLAVVCMLIASRNNGKVPNDPIYIKRVAFLDRVDFQPLIKSGFLIPMLADASTVQADAIIETEAEERQRREEESLVGKKNSRRHTPEVLKQAKEILEFLNHKAKRNYRPVDANLDFIVARLESGVDFQDLKSVIAKKCREWLGDPKMENFLRPATLFNKTKFEQYVGELFQEVPDENMSRLQ
jgi:uncharacterized phage protein (TIGR02220 family)